MLAKEPSLSLARLISQNPSGYLGKEHARIYDSSPGILVKVIDAAERLTIQVHPNRKTAAELFDSRFGKTECWHILGGREVDGEPPCVYLGFRPGITPEYWEELFRRQDTEGMLDCLHRFPVAPGDTILVEGSVPHAIGAGCYLVEIQEPTDFTIRVERKTPTGLVVEDEACHQGLGFQKMFSCFHYQGYTRESAMEKWFLAQQREKGVGYEITELVGQEQTPYFGLRRLSVSKKLTLSADERFFGSYVFEGIGKLYSGCGTYELKPGSVFFFPAGVGDSIIENSGSEPVQMLQYFGPFGKNH